MADKQDVDDKPIPPANQPPPPQHALPPAPSHRPNPLIRQSELQMDFGRLDSTMIPQYLTVSIGNQDTVSTTTFDQLHQLTTVDAPLTRNEFIRVWKSIILRRVQDVIEQDSGVRSEDYIRISRATRVPGPLFDILNCLGTYQSSVRGTPISIALPARPAVLPDWYNLDPRLLRDYTAYIARMEPKYKMFSFPPANDYTGRTITLTTLHDHDNLRNIRAYTSEATPDDALIRLAHDNIFTAHNRISYNHSYLYMAANIYRPAIVYDYVACYARDV